MYKVYQIKVGDTIETIANDLGVDANVIRELNSSMDFSVGEYIIVPNKQNDYFKTYIVKKGDSLYTIARQIGISVDDLVMLNGLNKNEYIYPNQELLIPNDNIDIYITKMGDTLENVINKLNTDYNTMKQQNSTIYLLPEQLIINKKR